jgi:hypothetical protein
MDSDTIHDDPAHVQHLGTDDTDMSDYFTLNSPNHILALHHEYASDIDSSIPTKTDTDDTISALLITPNIQQLPSIHIHNTTPHLVQVDGNADHSTTLHHVLVHNLCPPCQDLGEITQIKDAREHSHQIIGYGHFHV